jgi:hypothetical protein
MGYLGPCISGNIYIITKHDLNLEILIWEITASVK